MKQKKILQQTKFLKMLRKNYLQVLLTYGIFIIMIATTIVYVSDLVNRQMFDLSEETIHTTQTIVNDEISAAEDVFLEIHREMEGMVKKGTDKNAIEDLFEDVNAFYVHELSPMPEFIRIYGYINDEFISVAGEVVEGYNPLERDWYIGASSSDGTFLTDPYDDAGGAGICLTIAKKLSLGGVNPNVLAIDINLTQITKLVGNQKIANNGYGVFVNNNTVFLTHKNKAYIGKTVIETSDNYAKLAEMIANKAEIAGYRFRDYDGVESVAFFKQIFTGWYVGIIIPTASYSRTITAMIWTISLSGLAFATLLSAVLVHVNLQKMRSDEISASKSNFLTRMSHEMRTPMNAIIGMTQIAKTSENEDAKNQCLMKISDASSHLLGIINDVLDMAKIESGKLDLSPTNFKLDKLIQLLETMIIQKIEEKQQQFKVSIDKNIPPILFGDQQRLSQVILNLLSNANKFTPEKGTISLTIKLDTILGDVCRITFEIEDNGVGISPENQEKLFSAFEQADNSITRKFGGTGLGLAISKRIIELMKGKISLESQIDVGTTISFNVEMGIGQETLYNETRHDEENLENIFKDLNLLIAEDVEINQEIITTLLEITGINITCTANGQEVFDTFANDPQKYDLIFMDIHMPEIDGLQATQLIRSLNNPWAKQIPIIAMTADVFKADIEKCRDAGLNDHTGKPLNMKEVINKIRYYTSLKKR